jgi:hypothetical protein
VSDALWPNSEDAVKQLLDRANVLLAGGAPDPDRVEEIVTDTLRLAPRHLVQLDERARGYLSGLNWHRVPALRGAALDDNDRGIWQRVTRGRRADREPTDAALGLWHVLAFLSGDGYERERAVSWAPITPLTTRLLAIRSIDWVQQVRDAALARLDECPHDMIVEALPLVTQLAAERSRGQLLDSFLDARLSDDDLRSAYTADDVRTRRAAWQRLASRDVLTARELRELAAMDADALVRAVAANALADMTGDDRRELAKTLIEDRVGWIAVRALAARVDMDGPEAIHPALTARSAALRRAARDWAALRRIDARSVYLDRLAAQPRDALALVALGEMSDAQDVDVFQGMLTDSRARVRAAGLRALARVDRPAGRRAALEALDAGQAGRVAWAAAEVLRDGVPSTDEAHVLARVALDASRSAGQRFRALSLIRPMRWLHLAVMLEAHEQTTVEEVRLRLRGELNAWNGSRLTRAPDVAIRARIERLLPALDAEKRRWVEFVLRTSS